MKAFLNADGAAIPSAPDGTAFAGTHQHYVCLLYTSDAADERSSVDLGGRRIIKKKKKLTIRDRLRS